MMMNMIMLNGLSDGIYKEVIVNKTTTTIIIMT